MPKKLTTCCKNIVIFFILTCCFLVISCEQVLQTFTGEVGGGNYSYFTMRKEGEVTLILDSLKGDADLYVSQSTLKPDYEHYDLQSTTCGRDIVTVPKDFKRPIGIAVYGHVHSLQSEYMLTVIIDYIGEVDTGNTLWGMESDDNHEKQESVLWVIFVSIIKIIFEIIL